MLVDLKPVGEGYMEDFHEAGGVGAVLRELQHLLHLGTRRHHRRDAGASACGRSRRGARSTARTSSRVSTPVEPVGGLVALRGSLAPGGAILKRAAATPRLFEHEGRAVVFSSLEDLAARIDDPDLDVTADDILVLQNAGPTEPRRHARGRLPADPQEARARRASRTWCASRTPA